MKRLLVDVLGDNFGKITQIRNDGKTWYKVQNPEYTGHPIRFELDTESGNNWTLNPVLTGQ